MVQGSLRRRAVFVLLGIALVLVQVVILVAVAELVLVVKGFRFSPFCLDEPLFEEGPDGAMITAPVFTDPEPYGFPFVVEQRFDADKAEGTVRVAILGASSVYQLEAAEPLRAAIEAGLGRPVELLNMGFQGRGSERVLVSARQALELQTDILLVYTGHNEFVSFERQGEPDGIDSAPPLRLIQYAARRRLEQNPPDREELLGLVRTYDEAEKAAVYRRYRENLEALVTLARQAGAKVVIGTVAFNYEAPPMFDNGPESGGQDPYDASDPAQVRRQLQADPGNPFLEFELGTALLARGEIAAAKQALEGAFQHDGRPARATAENNRIVRELAQEHGLALAAVQGAVLAAQEQGLPGNDWFHDHCHLNGRGVTVLMGTFADAAVAAFQGASAGGESP